MHTFFPFLLFSFSSALTPGPNNFMILNSGLNFGVKKSLRHFLGICFGFPLMVLAIALGFGLVFEHYLWIEKILKAMGSLYMVYLAVQIWNYHGKANNDTQTKPLTFTQALVFQWVNPKAWLMGVGAISLFALANNYWMNALAVSSIFLLMCLPCTGVWLLFGSQLQRILTEDRHRHLFNKIMAIALLASIILIIKD